MRISTVTIAAGWCILFWLMGFLQEFSPIGPFQGEGVCSISAFSFFVRAICCPRKRKPQRLR